MQKGFPLASTHYQTFTTYICIHLELLFCHLQVARAGHCKGEHNVDSEFLQCYVCTYIFHGSSRGKQTMTTVAAVACPEIVGHQCTNNDFSNGIQWYLS